MSNLADHHQKSLQTSIQAPAPVAQSQSFTIRTQRRQKCEGNPAFAAFAPLRAIEIVKY
jgi:hypothetical protein